MRWKAAFRSESSGSREEKEGGREEMVGVLRCAEGEEGTASSSSSLRFSLSLPATWPHTCEHPSITGRRGRDGDGLLARIGRSSCKCNGYGQLSCRGMGIERDRWLGWYAVVWGTLCVRRWRLPTERRPQNQHPLN